MTEKLSRYGLAGNTFLEERHDFPMVGRNEEWQLITDVLEELIKADSCGIMVIHGDYGMGKTFTLKRIKNEIDKGAIRDQNGDILATFLKAAESQVPSNYLANLMTRAIREMGREALESIAKKAKLDKLNIDETVRSVFENIARGDVNAWNWIIGRNLSSSQLKEIGASYKVTSTGEIQTVFSNLLRILRSAGYRNFVLILDEWEYLLSLAGGNKLRSVIRDLQVIWDDYNEAAPDTRKTLCKVIFLIGSSPDSWYRFVEMAEVDRKKRGGGGTETFLRRIPEKAKISLSPLRDKDVREFLINRLQVYRVNDEVKDPLSPFDDSYVKFISEISMGIPSHILNLTSLVIDEAATRGIKIIDRSAAEEILKRYGLLRELQEVTSSK